MPSKSKTKPALDSFSLFAALLILTLFLWFIYRSLFSFPVLFDETIGKALFFGLPMWMFVSMTQFEPLAQTLSLAKLKSGLLRGLAFGGLFGFAGAITAYLLKGGIGNESIIRAPVFVLDKFWWEFLLALLTSFWESLFFFGFVQQVLNQELTKIASWQKILFTSLIFLLFHVPNSVLRFGGPDVVYQLFLLFLFGLGQALVFENYKNGYILILTQTFWGMVLLVHF